MFEGQTDSGYPAHRQSAYEGLARTGTAKVTAPRIEGALASERDKRVRLAMSFALASAGRPIAPLVDASLDDDLTDQALEYLVEIGPAHAVDLAARLRDQDPVVRENVAIALGFVGGPDAAAALTAAGTDTNPEVRNAVQVAQLRLRGGKPNRATCDVRRADVLLVTCYVLRATCYVNSADARDAWGLMH